MAKKNSNKMQPNYDPKPAEKSNSLIAGGIILALVSGFLLAFVIRVKIF